MSSERIQEAVKAQEGFVRWLVESWRAKNWLRLLLVLEAVNLLFLNPKTASIAFNLVGRPMPARYPIAWLAVSVFVFLLAVIVALHNRPITTTRVNTERRTIKGLRPFALEDAEVYAKLQRSEISAECLTSIADTQYRFGILTGESGSGKTSFLQAGLWPQLSGSGYQCVYVKVTDLDPLEALKAAIVESRVAGTEVEVNPDFAGLLDRVANHTGKPVVLILDQFEQFFIHHKRQVERKDFVRMLADWYKRHPRQSAKIVICIRNDFTDRLIELQKAMGYSLGPQEVFRLEKFEPREAALVLSVIAETEGIVIDHRFVEEIAERELASPEDGRISPVDIQILAWMVAGQQVLEDRAFNRAAYDSLGGIEGLLERFLKRALEARETPGRKQASVNVLVTLTDFEKDSRAGALSLSQLQKKLENSGQPHEVEEAVSWLARSDVRLLTPTRQSGFILYELAHERLIPALRRIAAKELTEVDQAKQLLNRRVNEWLASDRKSSYLLRLGEIRLIKHHRSSVITGPHRTTKQAFYGRSLRRFRMKLLGSALAGIVIATLLTWWFSPYGEIWQTERELNNLVAQINDPETISYIAQNLLKIGRVEEARALTPRLTSEKKLPILINVRHAYERAANSRAVEELRQEERIQTASLGSMEAALIYSQLGEKKDALELLNQDRQERPEPFLFRPSYIVGMAEAYSQVGDPKQASELLLEAVKDTDVNDDPALMVRMVSTCELIGSALCERKTLETILTREPRLQAQDSIWLLNTAAKAFSNLGYSREAEDLLGRSQARVKTLRAKGYLGPGHLKASELAALLLAAGGAVAAAIVNPRSVVSPANDYPISDKVLDAKTQSRIFKSAPQAYITLALHTQKKSLLESAENMIVALNESDQVETYCNLFSAYLDFDDEENALKVLRRLCDIAARETRLEKRESLKDFIATGLRRLPEKVRESITFAAPDVASTYITPTTNQELLRDPLRQLLESKNSSDVCMLCIDAQTYWSEAQTATAHRFLAEADRRTADSSTFDVFFLLAEAYTISGDTQQATGYLKLALKRAVTLAPDAKASSLISIASTCAKNGQWRLAREAANDTGNDLSKATALSNIMVTWNGGDVGKK